MTIQNVQTRLELSENEAGEENLNRAVDAKNTGVQRLKLEFPTVAANSRWLFLTDLDALMRITHDGRRKTLPGYFLSFSSPLIRLLVDTST